MPIEPQQLAANGSEAGHQSAFFCWAALQENVNRYRNIELMFAIPNGGKRDAREAGNLKAQGVKAGVLDIMLPVPLNGYHGLFIEMKRKPNELSDKQKEFFASMLQLGYKVELCWDWVQACHAVDKYYFIRSE